MPQGSQRFNRTPSPLQIELGPSRLLVAGLAAAYGAALSVLLLSPLPTAVIGIAAIVLLITGWRDVANCSQIGSKRRVRRLVLSTERDWIIMNGAGVPTRGRPVDTQVVHPWAVAFTLADKDGNRKPVLVLPDMTSRQSFHALRLWLRQSSRAGSRGTRA